MRDLENTIRQLNVDKGKLENKVSERKAEIEILENKKKEKKEALGKKRETEIDFLKYQEQHLNKFLK